MEDKPSKEKTLFLDYSEKASDLLNSAEGHDIYDAIAQGKNTYLRKDRTVSGAFDTTWIDAIENCLPDLGNVVMNPRTKLKTVTELVPVEKARKTNQLSVQHLASHTQYVKEIDENGNVIPKSILNIEGDDDIHTYENKFIATLVRKLMLFVEQRYQYLSKFTELKDHSSLYFKSLSTIHDTEVSIETKIEVIAPQIMTKPYDKTALIKRIKEIRRYISFYYNTPFMKQMKVDRDVRNPIMQTNVIRKNPAVHHCFELYCFIEGYSKLGIDYDVHEEFANYNKEELRDLNLLLMVNYLSLGGRDKPIDVVPVDHHYSPVVLTADDEEQFVYGPIFKGPVSFVRTDKPYRAYLEHKAHKDIPDLANAAPEEKAYFGDDVKEMQDAESDEAAVRKLETRKVADENRFNKKARMIVQRREQRLLDYQKNLEDQWHQKETLFLNKLRQRISDDADEFRIERKAQYQASTVQPAFNLTPTEVQKDLYLSKEAKPLLPIQIIEQGSAYRDFDMDFKHSLAVDLGIDKESDDEKKEDWILDELSDDVLSRAKENNDSLYKMLTNGILVMKDDDDMKENNSYYIVKTKAGFSLGASGFTNDPAEAFLYLSLSDAKKAASRIDGEVILR
ncbi:MAG: hypothetical protein WCS91_05000 [Bacilli bacterium]